MSRSSTRRSRTSTVSADLVITQKQLTDRARQQSPNSVHVSVDNFMNSPRYDEVVDLVRAQHQEGPERLRPRGAGGASPRLHSRRRGVGSASTQPSTLEHR